MPAKTALLLVLFTALLGSCHRPAPVTVVFEDEWTAERYLEAMARGDGEMQPISFARAVEVLCGHIVLPFDPGEKLEAEIEIGLRDALDKSAGDWDSLALAIDATPELGVAAAGGQFLHCKHSASGRSVYLWDARNPQALDLKAILQGVEADAFHLALSGEGQWRDLARGEMRLETTARLQIYPQSTP